MRFPVLRLGHWSLLLDSCDWFTHWHNALNVACERIMRDLDLKTLKMWRVCDAPMRLRCSTASPGRPVMSPDWSSTRLCRKQFWWCPRSAGWRCPKPFDHA